MINCWGIRIICSTADLITVLLATLFLHDVIKDTGEFINIIVIMNYADEKALYLEQIGWGTKMNLPIASVFYVYLASSIVIVSIRNLVWGRIRNKRYRAIFNEFICSFLWCTWCLELRIMANNFVVQSLILYLFICSKQFVCRGAFTNPCGVLADQLVKQKPLKETWILLITELCGTVCAVMYSYSLCSVLALAGLSQDHADFYYLTYHTSPLTVNPLWGLMVELAFTLILCVMDGLFSPPLDAIFTATIYMILYVLFGHHTGAFVNPLTATASLLGREGESSLAIFIVYWLGPLLGTAGAMWILPANQ